MGVTIKLVHEANHQLYFLSAPGGGVSDVSALDNFAEVVM